MALTQIPQGMLASDLQNSTPAFKNRIINGDMRIDQRLAGAAITPAGVYTLDRWKTGVTQPAKFTVQQNAGAITPPVGFSNYLGVTSTSAYSVISSDEFTVFQPIEGFNIADLAWGTASAKTVTLSFQVYSSLTGTFGGSLNNSALNRVYSFAYSIPVANTWTTVSVTIPGDTTGTWLTTSGVGVYLQFSIGAGSTKSGTANTWSSGYTVSVAGATSVVGTSGATWYVTSVQLEKGSAATQFDMRSYGAELLLCLRYCVVDSNGSGAYRWFSSGMNASATGSAFSRQFQIPMRTTPSITPSTQTGFIIDAAGGATVTTAVSDSVFSTPTVARLVTTVASGLVAGQAVGLASDSNSTLKTITYSAEL